MYSSVTGMANDGTYLLVHGNDYYGDPVIQKFSSTGSTGSLYMDDFPGIGSTRYDTAWMSGGIWIARDDPDSPILGYDTTGLLVGYVDGSTVSAAMGLTMDGEGYLWASNPDDDRIYQIEVLTGIGELPEVRDHREITLSLNPFSSSVVITAGGFADATLEIFDLAGRRVHESVFTGVHTWNAPGVPAGTYFAVVRDREGTSSAGLTRID
ncbi:MAG: hypothetical protein AVO35_11810 [Candidatus Aegiribacteria sp. MLS_C]|nr:MAG: hypothetical protein AVO35_11810 [Candidatus Aegiribacteria sp. MLS_C]